VGYPIAGVSCIIADTAVSNASFFYPSIAVSCFNVICLLASCYTLIKGLQRGSYKYYVPFIAFIAMSLIGNGVLSEISNPGNLSTIYNDTVEWANCRALYTLGLSSQCTTDAPTNRTPTPITRAVCQLLLNFATQTAFFVFGLTKPNLVFWYWICKYIYLRQWGELSQMISGSKRRKMTLPHVNTPRSPGPSLQNSPSDLTYSSEITSSSTQGSDEGRDLSPMIKPRDTQ